MAQSGSRHICHPSGYARWAIQGAQRLIACEFGLETTFRRLIAALFNLCISSAKHIRLRYHRHSVHGVDLLQVADH